MPDFMSFFENLVQYGLEYFRKCYGVYRAEVVDTKDPEKRGRIRIMCPEVGHSAPLEVWVDPVFPGAGPDFGMFWPPLEGDFVWVMFDAGDPSKPKAYFGGWFGAPGDSSEIPEEFSYDGDLPDRRGIKSFSGHSLTFDDADNVLRLRWNNDAGTQLEFQQDGTLEVVSGGSSLRLESSGKLEIQDSSGNKITMENGKISISGVNSVEITGGSVNIRSADVTVGEGLSPEPIPKGQTLVQWLLTHTHGSAVGPTTPPLVPLPPTTLSGSSKVK